MRRFFILVAAAIGLHEGSAFGACQLGQLVQFPVNMVGLRPTITTKVNGADAVFVVDSGASFSIITPAAARQFHLRLEPPPYGLRVAGIGGQTQYSVATVAHFLFGPVDLRNAQFIVGGNQLGGGALGLLGQNILHVGDIEYDLANGVMRVLRPVGCKNADLAYWAKDKPTSMMEIQVTSPAEPHARGIAYLNGKKIRVMFDTGVPLSLISLRAAARAGVAPGQPGVTSDGYTSGLGPAVLPLWIAHFNSFKIGEEQISNIYLRIGDVGGDDFDMLIGDDFFLAHRIYVASSQNRLYFTYNGGPVFNLRAYLPPQVLKVGASASAAPVPPSGSLPTSGSPANTPSAPAASAAAWGAPGSGDEPADAAGFALRGAALAARGEFVQAIADMTRACQLDPNEPHYFEQRGVAELRLRQPMRALADFDQTIKLEPNDVIALLARAQLRLMFKDRSAALSQALSDLRAVDLAVPKQADVRYALAADYIRADEYDAAVTQFSLWLDAHPSDVGAAGALNGRCWGRAMVGQQLKLALDDCNAALRLSPTHALQVAILDSRGFVRLRLGDYARSLGDYNEVLKIQPKRAWSLYGRGIDELRQGNTAAAHADMQAAEALQPSIADDFRKAGVKP